MYHTVHIKKIKNQSYEFQEYFTFYACITGRLAEGVGIGSVLTRCERPTSCGTVVTEGADGPVTGVRAVWRLHVDARHAVVSGCTVTCTTLSPDGGLRTVFRSNPTNP